VLAFKKNKLFPAQLSVTSDHIGVNGNIQIHNLIVLVVD